jgi:hypothetical protein
LINNFAHGSATVLNTVSADLTVSGACTPVTGGKNCTVTMNSAIGNDDYTFATYDVTPSNANFGTAAHQLGSATLSGITIAGNTTNTVNVALGGIIKTFSLPSGVRNFYSAYRPAAASKTGLAINGLDADGNIILAGGNTVTNGATQQTDTYANPITIAVTDNGGTGTPYTGHVMLSLNGGSPATSIQLTKSSDTFSASYDGNAGVGYYVTLGISASGATSPSPITVSTLSVSAAGNAANASVGGVNNTVGFDTTGQVETLTLNENQFAGTFTAVVTNAGTAACPNSPNLSVSINTGSLGASGTSFSLTAGTANTTNPGCQILVTDPVGGAAFTLGASAGVQGTGGSTIGVPTNIVYMTGFSSSQSARLAAISPNFGGSPGFALQSIVRAYPPDVSNNFTTSPQSLGQGSIGVTEPLGIAVDSSANVYVADGAGNQIVKYSSTQSGNTNPVTTITSAAMAYPDGLALDAAGRIYVADFQNQKVLVFAANASGASTPVATVTLNNGSQNLTPYALAIDSAGDVYAVVSVSTFRFVVEIPPISTGTSTQTPLKTFSTHGNGSAGVAVDVAGNVFVADSIANEIDLFTPTQNTQSGPTATFITSPGPNGGCPQYGPITVDGSGHLYAMCLPTTQNKLAYVVYTYSLSNPVSSTSGTIFQSVSTTWSNASFSVGFMAHT